MFNGTLRASLPGSLRLLQCLSLTQSNKSVWAGTYPPFGGLPTPPDDLGQVPLLLCRAGDLVSLEGSSQALGRAPQRLGREMASR